jgi:general secretion pathway protein D
MKSNWQAAFLVVLTGLVPLVRGQSTQEASPATGREGAASAARIRIVAEQNPASSLSLDFHKASLDSVLDYLSASAHLIINKEQDLHGEIDLSTSGPVGVDQAISRLNSALKRLGGTVLREGRILTIIRLDQTKTSDLEVASGSDPNVVEKSDEVITQIVPVRAASASQLATSLQPLLPDSASISVNESANSLILVATKTQIRRMLRIVAAVDHSMTSVSSLRVLPLRYADAKQLAAVIQQLFATQSAAQPNATPGPLGIPGGFGGPSDAASSSSTASGSGGGGKVVAVAEEGSNSLILGASSERMDSLVRIIRQLDQPVADVTEVRLFTLRNADPTELADQLAQLFPGGSSRRSEDSQEAIRFGGGPGGAPNNSGGFGGGPGGFGGGPGGGGPGGPPGATIASDSVGASTRSQKQTQVLAVPDPRTSTLLVSAASQVMPQIARMIENLDASPARKELVQVYELQNADPQDVSQILQDLFNRSGTTRNSTSDRTSLLGQGNPLVARATQQQSSSTTSGSGFGNVSGASGGGGQGSGSGF